MISKGIETAFHKVYYLIKLSLYFWGLSFIGLLIFGVTPAMMASVEAHNRANWDYDQLKWSNLFNNFKEYFKQGNQLFLVYSSIFLVLGYNLYLSLQPKGFLFLMLDFILIFVLFLLTLSFLINLAIVLTFDISVVNSMKLALIQFFANTKECFLLIFGLVMVSIVTIKFPGLILFITTGFLAIVISTSTNRMFKAILMD
ncbi:MAG: DUF624 domain-containing protein [Carnobacterium sp.]